MEKTNEMKLHIVQSLSQLMERTTIDKICITQLCAESHISRQTFYRNFPDKYSVIHWHFDLIAEDSLKQVGRTLSWKEAHIRILNAFYNARPLYAHGYSNDFNAINKYGYRASSALYLDTLKNHIKFSPSDSLLFQADAAAMLCTTLSSRWWTSGMKEHPSELADLFDSVLPQELKYTLDQQLS